MKAKMFEDLLESVREGGAILRGELKPSRRFAKEQASRYRSSLVSDRCLEEGDHEA
jgi:hypothetical protein